MAAFGPESLAHGVDDAGVHHHGLLGGGSHAVVEGLAPHDVVGGPRDVGGALDEGRALTDARVDEGLARFPRFVQERGHARIDDQRDALVAHEFARAAAAGRFETGETAFGQARRLRGLGHEGHHARRAARRSGMGRKNDGVARLDGHERLMHRGGDRVRHGSQRGDDADGHADVHQLLFGIFREDAHAAQTQQGVEHVPADEADLRQLVPPRAAVRFLMGHDRQFPGLFRHGLPHGRNHGVKPVLREARQQPLRFESVFSGDPRVLHREQIVVHDHGPYSESYGVQKLRTSGFQASTA